MKIIIQANSEPKAEIDTMRMKAECGAMTLSSPASAIPPLETSNADSGTPRALRVPKRAGASPARARLNIMRVVM